MAHPTHHPGGPTHHYYRLFGVGRCKYLLNIFTMCTPPMAIYVYNSSPAGQETLLYRDTISITFPLYDVRGYRYTILLDV